MPIQQQDVFTLPSESFLYIEGKLVKNPSVAADTALNVELVNNAIAFLFEEIRYELAGVVVDHTRNVGVTSTIKTFLSLNNNAHDAMENAGWVAPTANVLKVNDDGEFNFCIPLKMLMGFAEDYTRIVLNVKQELIDVYKRQL